MFKLWISVTAVYTSKVKKTALYPPSQSSYWQSWKHRQGFLHVWAVWLFSFTRSVSEGHYWAENDPSPIKDSLDLFLWASLSSYRHRGRLGEEFCFPLTQQPGNPLLTPLFSLAWRPQGWKICFLQQEGKKGCRRLCSSGWRWATPALVPGTAPRGTALHHQSILLQSQPGAKKAVLVKACTAYPNHQGGCNQKP